MLKMISCDKFISYGKPRGPIYFRQGLNTILGTSDGANSIGKSTFLMILDFVFGGTDYLDKRTKEILSNEQAGPHTINFTFEFDGQEYYFFRNTSERSVVHVCNSSFQENKAISLTKFNEFLQRKYGIDQYQMSFRDAVSPYIRVYHRDTMDEKRPLKTAPDEKVKEEIIRLIKLYGHYQGLDEANKKLDDVTDRESNIRKAVTYSLINAPKNQTEFKSNQKRIEELEEKRKELSEKSNKGLAELDALQAEQLAEIKAQLRSLRRQRTRLEGQIKAIEDGVGFSSKSAKNDYEELKRFFPDANIAAIEEVEEFHNQLAKILSKERKESLDSLKETLAITNGKIEELEKRQEKIPSTPNVSQAVLEQYSEIETELSNLKRANANFQKSVKLKEEKTHEQDSFNTLVVSETSNLTKIIDAEMSSLNDFIYGGAKTAPVIDIQDYKNYEFKVINDGGTGAQYRGLIIFDLAALRKTALPLLVHDSPVFKQVEDYAMPKILELYEQSAPKQVFIAFDKADSYGEEAKAILDRTKVLSLSSGGNELFGKSWNEVKH